MKTADLITALVEDASQPQWSTAQRVFGAAVLAIGVAAVLFALTLGVRSDIGSAIGTGRFLFKVGLTVVCAACAWRACLELARPEVLWRHVAGWIALAPALLAVGVLYELVEIAPTHWSERTIGNYAGTCLLAIPLLSIVPLITLLMALRAGAPRGPGSAGAAAGLLAGALSAAIYSTHCPDDLPLFVAAWYTLAVGLVTITGALAGRRVLRW